MDPIISNPASSQSINPYSYIGNNLLSGTDPTGYCAEGTEQRTGSRICQSVDSVSTSSLTVNGREVGSGSNTLLGAVKDYLKQFTSGARDQGTAQANTNPTDQGGPGDTSKESEPSFQGLKDWVSEKYQGLKSEFTDTIQREYDRILSGMLPGRAPRNEVEADHSAQMDRNKIQLARQGAEGTVELFEEVGNEGGLYIAGTTSSRLLGKALEAAGLLRAAGSHATPPGFRGFKEGGGSPGHPPAAWHWRG